MSEQNSSDEDVQILDLDEDDDVSEDNVTFDKLFAFLMKETDIIIEINAEDEEPTRRGLSVCKHTHAKRLEKAGADTDDRQLKFKVLGRSEDLEPKTVRLQIWLQARQKVKLHKLIVSDKGI